MSYRSRDFVEAIPLAQQTAQQVEAVQDRAVLASLVRLEFPG